MSIANQPVRTIMSYAVVFLFLVSLLYGGIQNLHTSVRETLDDPRFSLSDGSEQVLKGFPDFGHYVHLRTITVDELAPDDRRLIFVGDIHGMKSSLDTLLSRLSYSPSRDLLVHLGDIIAKGPDSFQVLSQFSDANITGVRGNHEQTVIGWRAWIEWVEGQHGGKDWLEKLERQYPRGIHLKEQESHRLRWSIPQGWRFMTEPYTFARQLTASQYIYLKSLPLVIHLPSLHTHAVHAGILPFNPENAPDSPGQPLARTPVISSPPPQNLTRHAQERALLANIKQNTDPWVLLNIRSVLESGNVSRDSRKGTPWSEIWDMTMRHCRGFHHSSASGFAVESHDGPTSTSYRLSCLPISVVYGHAAARGLVANRWSFGLDSGCVKGQQLTAMVISKMNNSMPVVDARTRKVAFGENGMAQLISISCPKP